MKTKLKKRSDELRPEYDFRGGIRGKYARRYAEGTNVVVIDPDVADSAFAAKQLRRHSFSRRSRLPQDGIG